MTLIVAALYLSIPLKQYSPGSSAIQMATTQIKGFLLNFPLYYPVYFKVLTSGNVFLL